MKHKEEARKAIADLCKNAGDKTVVFSSEYLVFPFSVQHIDPLNALDRIQQLFEGFEIQIVLILRQQGSFLKSLYGEYVRLGYPETYSGFIHWVWAYRDRNFWEVLDYHQTCQNLWQRFGKENVRVDFFEDWKQDPGKKINEKMAVFLNLVDKNLPIRNDNPSFTLSELANLLYINRQSPRGMGKHILAPFENHRNKVLLTRLEAGYTNDEIFENVHAKRWAFAQINKEPQQPFDHFYKLSNEADVIYEQMKTEWRDKNQQLQTELNNLPKGYIL